MSENNHQLFAAMQHNLGTLNNLDPRDTAGCIREIRNGVNNAAYSYKAMMHLPAEAANAIGSVFNQMNVVLDQLFDKVAAQFGLSEEQREGLAYSFGIGYAINEVDNVLRDEHPVVRMAYLDTVTRMLTFGALAGTVIDAKDKGIFPDDAAFKNARIVTLAGFECFDGEPVSFKVIREISNDAPNTSDLEASNNELVAQQQAAREVAESLQGLIDKTPAGPARDRLSAHLNALRAEYGLSDDDGNEPEPDVGVDLSGINVHETDDGSVIGEGIVRVPEGVDPIKHIAQIVAASINAKGGERVTVEKIETALRASKGPMTVINLKDDDNG